MSTLQMDTMTLYETGDSTGAVSLRSLFDHPVDPTPVKPVSVEELIGYCVRGGWPASRELPLTDAALVPREYLREIITEDAQTLDNTPRNQKKLGALIHSLGRNESTLATRQVLIKDMQASDTSVTVDPDTVTTYLEILKRLFIIHDQPSFQPRLRSTKRLLRSPKRHFVDPSLAVAALGATGQMLLEDLETFGFIFEALCEHDLRIYASAHGGNLFHYRDGKGNEIDAIIELPDGRWGAFEIKLGTHQIDAAAAHLRTIAASLGKAGATPSFLCVISGMAAMAYTRDDGVRVVPITALRD